MKSKVPRFAVLLIDTCTCIDIDIDTLYMYASVYTPTGAKGAGAWKREGQTQSLPRTDRCDCSVCRMR